MTLRVWIDTDVGDGPGDNPDDVVALACAVAHPHVELVGVSTVGDDVDRRAALATSLLASMGIDPLVYAGPPDPRALRTADAVLAIGPLTNLAALVRAGVSVGPVAAMGGVRGRVFHRGAWRREERNFAADLDAATTILASVTDLLVVPLDVTAAMVLAPFELDALLRVAPGLRSHVDRFLTWQAARGVPPEHRGVCLSDPLALLALAGEPCVRVEPTPIAVGEGGSLVVGERHVDCVVDVERASALDRVLGLVADTARGHERANSADSARTESAEGD